jgi:hypothetical protein
MMQRHAILFTSKAARAIVVVWDDHQVNENGEAMVGIVKRPWSMNILISRIPKNIQTPGRWKSESGS